MLVSALWVNHNTLSSSGLLNQKISIMRKDFPGIESILKPRPEHIGSFRSYSHVLDISYLETGMYRVLGARWKGECYGNPDEYVNTIGWLSISCLNKKTGKLTMQETEKVLTTYDFSMPDSDVNLNLYSHIILEKVNKSEVEAAWADDLGNKILEYLIHLK